MNGIKPLDALRRFWWVVLVFTIAGAGVGGYPSPEESTDSITTWNAAHTLLISNTSTDGNSFTDPQQFNQLQLFATTGEVTTRAAESIGYTNSPAALAAQITVTADQQTGALQISTTQNTADAAVDVADAFAEELVTYISERQDQLRQNRLSSTLTRLEDLEGQIADIEPTVLIPPADPLDPDATPTEDPIARSELDALSRQYSVVFEQFNQLQADHQLPSRPADKVDPWTGSPVR